VFDLLKVFLDASFSIVLLVTAVASTTMSSSVFIMVFEQMARLGPIVELHCGLMLDESLCCVSVVVVVDCGLVMDNGFMVRFSVVMILSSLGRVGSALGALI